MEKLLIKELKERIKNGDIDACFELGNIYLNKKESEKAKSCYLKIILNNQRNYEAYKQLGKCYYLLNEYEKAEAQWLKAIEINPQYSAAYNNLGVMYSEQGKHDKVEEYYLKAIEFDPKNESFYSALGTMYQIQGKYDEAINWHKKMLDFSNDKGYIYCNLGSFYLKIGDSKKAEEYYLKAIEFNSKDSSAYYNLGLLYRTKGNDDKAEEYYLKAIELDPGYSNVYNNLGVIYLNRNKFDKAEEYYLKAIEVNNNYLRPYLNLANLYNYDLGQYDKAEEYYLKALKIKDDKFAYLDLGKLYDTFLNNRGKNGFEYVQKSMKLNCTYAYIYAASYYYEKKISFEEAEKYLQKAIELKNPEAYLELGNLYSTIDKEKAIEYYTLAEKNGIECEYEIKQINNRDNEFVVKLRELANTSNIDKNSVLRFCKSFIGDDFDKLQSASKDMFVRCISEYMLETKLGLKNINYSSSILSMAKVLENELDKYLGTNLYQYIKKRGLEDKYPDIVLRKHSRTLGEYDYEYKRETRVFDEAHLLSLRRCFKDDVFSGVNGDIHLTNYITNFVKDIKEFSKRRNVAMHKGSISKEDFEKWIDKMIGSGQMLQNFLHKLK